jgi:hypothetical protein
LVLLTERCCVSLLMLLCGELVLLPLLLLLCSFWDDKLTAGCPCRASADLLVSFASVHSTLCALQNGGTGAGGPMLECVVNSTTVGHDRAKLGEDFGQEESRLMRWQKSAHSA